MPSRLSKFVQSILRTGQYPIWLSVAAWLDNRRYPYFRRCSPGRRKTRPIPPPRILLNWKNHGNRLAPWLRNVRPNSRRPYDDRPCTRHRPKSLLHIRRKDQSRKCHTSGLRSSVEVWRECSWWGSYDEQAIWGRFAHCWDWWVGAAIVSLCCVKALSSWLIICLRYHTDPSGTFMKYDAKAIGSGSEAAQSELQDKWHRVCSPCISRNLYW